MMFNFLKRITNVLLIPPLLFFVNEVVAQCDVFIEPGSVSSQIMVVVSNLHLILLTTRLPIGMVMT